MRAASILACLALAVICLFFSLALHDMAVLAFTAGPAALTPGAAWTGLFAFAFQVWFMSLLLASVASAVKAAPRHPPAWLDKLSTDTLTYRATSISQFWKQGSNWCIVAIALSGSLGFSLVAFAMLTGVFMLEQFRGRRTGKEMALWHRLPRFAAWLATFALVLGILLLIESASFGHFWQTAHALVGQNALAETSLLLNARLFTDFHVLLMIASVILIFAVPPLIPLVRIAGRWKQIPAAAVLLVAILYFALPSVQTRMKSWLANGLGQGSGRVVAADGGWLFDAREVEALTEAGPLAPIFSLSGAPVSDAKNEILAFASGLKERGIPLLLIPIPMKASIYPEAITHTDPDDSVAPLYHPDQPAFYEQLAKAGIDVQDITEAFMQLKTRHKDVFLRQDSHWTPEAMQDIARATAAHVRKRYPGLIPADPLIVDTKAPDASGMGDLARRLYPTPWLMLKEESKVLVSFPELKNDPQSSITLLGDDYVRIFDDPALEFDAGADNHASFAQHLALYLGTRIDTLATTYGAVNTSRQEFAQRFDDVVRSKKLIIWLIPARELMLPKKAWTSWFSAPFNTQSSPPEVLEPMVPKGP
ncbi:MAG: hypothetical protein JWO94_1304 [Verrucomicrobiaceae bacterium]|nr:hypothetical protein [Verrucomicrobiaceae bacterium]